MTTFELTWQQDVNRVVPDVSTVLVKSQWVIWYFASFLLGNIGGAASGLWTCEGSSDSATAGMDTVNRWGTSFNAAKLVRNSGGAHSWIVLKSPAGLGPFYMCIDWASSSDNSVNVYFSKSAFAGGSTTARPTASNEWSYTNQTHIYGVAGQAETFQAILSTTGEFHFRSARPLSGVFEMWFGFFTLADTHAGEAHNGWSIFLWDQSTGHIYTNFSDSSGPYIRGRSSTPATSAVNANLASIATNHPTTGFTWTAQGIPTTDAVDATYNQYPIWVHVVTVGHRSLRGRIRDLWFAPISIGSATVSPSSGPPYQLAAFDDVWGPYSGSVVPTN